MINGLFCRPGINFLARKNMFKEMRLGMYRGSVTDDQNYIDRKVRFRYDLRAVCQKRFHT
jgi:hypothetical protein